ISITHRHQACFPCLQQQAASCLLVWLPAASCIGQSIKQTPNPSAGPFFLSLLSLFFIYFIFYFTLSFLIPSFTALFFPPPKFELLRPIPSLPLRLRITLTLTNILGIDDKGIIQFIFYRLYFIYL
ncbi:unnamed protein product, partial [Tuber aestivum]